MNRKNEWIAPIYHENRGRLIRLARRLLEDSDVQIAEDVVQKTFEELLKAGEEMQSHPNIAGWLCKTLSNVVKNTARLSHYRMEVPFPKGYEAVSGDWRENRPYELPSELTPEEREILLLVAMGYRPQDIAKMKGISPGACRVRLMRARRHVRILTQP